MGPQDFYDLMQARPFRPFRLFLTSGETIEVKQSLTGFPMSTRILVSHDYNDSGFPTRSEFIPYDAVAGHEYINPLSSTG